MRVVVLPADETACGFYRMKLPAGAVALARPDWSVEVYRPSDVKLGGDPLGNLYAIHGIPDPKSIDVLVMQRVSTRLQLSLLEWARNEGIATVLDTDDAMWCIDKANAAHPWWNGPQAHWSYIDKASAVVDLNTVTTAALAKRYGPRVEVLPNCVPGDLGEVLESVRPALDPTVTIGWAGFTATHPGDLKVVGDAVRRVVDETGCKVRVIGDAQGALREWGLETIDEVPPVTLGLPYYTALTSLDVALVPLRDTPFNRAKSYLKALEFSAVGVPVIASPTPANRELAKTVPVHLASTPEEWYQNLLFVLTDDRVRWARSVAGKAAAEEHTYEHNAERWAQAWERAAVRRHRMAV